VRYGTYAPRGGLLIMVSFLLFLILMALLFGIRFFTGVAWVLITIVVCCFVINYVHTAPFDSPIFTLFNHGNT
jgi:antibiotic biosynthesis monooxygenase (ABM) superfamily enzyme